MRARAGKLKRRGQKQSGVYTSPAVAIIERMQSAGVEFRFLPGGGLFVVGLSLCALDLRAAFLDGDGGALHQAARALSPSSGVVHV